MNETSNKVNEKKSKDDLIKDLLEQIKRLLSSILGKITNNDKLTICINNIKLELEKLEFNPDCTIEELNNIINKLKSFICFLENEQKNTNNNTGKKIKKSVKGNHL